MGTKRMLVCAQIVWLTTVVVPARAAILQRSFLNDLGPAVVVNDWHVFERNGNNAIVTLVSNGLAPTYTPMPATTQPAGNAAANQATLSGGGNVPTGDMSALRSRCLTVAYLVTPASWTGTGLMPVRRSGRYTGMRRPSSRV